MTQQPKHTPGPWHVGVNPGPIIYCDKYGSQIVNMREPFGQTEEQNKANAHLIAGAPEMLEALDNLQADITIDKASADYDPHSLVTKNNQAMADKWSAIIAKAKGE